MNKNYVCRGGKFVGVNVCVNLFKGPGRWLGLAVIMLMSDYLTGLAPTLATQLQQKGWIEHFCCIHVYTQRCADKINNNFDTLLPR